MLYLGRVSVVLEPGHLQRVGIMAVLTVNSEEPYFQVEGLWRLFVPALDKPKTDLLSHLDQYVAFVGQAHAEGHTMLVHCRAGVS